MQKAKDFGFIIIGIILTILVIIFFAPIMLIRFVIAHGS